MRRFDKKQNIFEANLRLEREFITQKNLLINSTANTPFINACLESNFFNENEKSFIVESVLPNTKLLSEGGWDWFKSNIIDPTVNAVKTGAEKVANAAKSFWNKLKTVFTNIGNFFKKCWELFKKWTSWTFDKIVNIVKSRLNKSKDKLEVKLAEFQEKCNHDDVNICDQEIEQLKLTYQYWVRGGGDIMSKGMESTFGGDIEGKSESMASQTPEELKESWSSDVIDLFSGENKLIKESSEGGMSSKIKKFLYEGLTWILKGIIKGFEKFVGWVAQGILIAGSKITDFFGGPGTFKFKHLSHFIGGLLVTLSEGILLTNNIAEDFGKPFLGHGGLGIFGDVIHGWEHMVEEFLIHWFGHFTGLKWVLKSIEIIGFMIGIYETYQAISHMKHSSSEKETIDKLKNKTSDKEGELSLDTGM